METGIKVWFRIQVIMFTIYVVCLWGIGLIAAGVTVFGEIPFIPVFILWFSLLHKITHNRYLQILLSSVVIPCITALNGYIISGLVDSNHELDIFIIPPVCIAFIITIFCHNIYTNQPEYDQNSI